jgi:hypothetical protein
MQPNDKYYGTPNLYNKAAIIGWYRSGANIFLIGQMCGLSCETVEIIIDNHLLFEKQPPRVNIKS